MNFFEITFFEFNKEQKESSLKIDKNTLQRERKKTKSKLFSLRKMESDLGILDLLIIIGNYDNYSKIINNEIFNVYFFEKNKRFLKLNPNHTFENFKKLKSNLKGFKPRKIILNSVSGSEVKDYCNCINMNEVDYFYLKAEKFYDIYYLYSFLHSGLQLREIDIEISLTSEGIEEFRFSEFMEYLAGIQRIR